MANPLSPFTYHRRHKRQTLLLVSLVALVTLGVCVMAGMLYPILEHNSIVVLGPLSHFSLVYPAAGLSLEPTIVSQIRAHPDVAQVIPENGLGLYILGPSGSGKSSLLYLLSGLRRATEGEVYLDDRAYGKMPERERVALRRTEFGFVFQQHFLINYLTVLENVMVAAPMQDKAHAEQARALLADLGIGDKLHRFPYELSGGERQRTAVARAMIHRPRIIFADEPTGLLDRRTGLQVMALLRGYREQGSLIAVTHNPEILAEADLVITLRGGQISKVEDRLARAARNNGS